MLAFMRGFLPARGQLYRGVRDEISESIPYTPGFFRAVGSPDLRIDGFITDLSRLDSTLIDDLRGMVGQRDLAGPGFNCPQCGEPIEISRWDLPEFIAALVWDGRFDHVTA